MITVDTRGQVCPAPLIAAKKALRNTVTGDYFMILTDNRTSFDNLTRYLKDNHTEVSTEENDGIWKLKVRKLDTHTPVKKAEDYCTPAHFEKGDFIIVFSSDKMGEGDDILGRLLIGNFLKALKDLERLPAKIIFYNKGVTLALKGSDHVIHLKQLEKMGVEILLCATCVNHFGIADKVGAGVLSNMYSIAESMATASKVIKP